MPTPDSDIKSSQENLVLIGYTLKPFGLFGELKVKPETFDTSRHELLKEVIFKKTEKAKAFSLTVEGSRYQAPHWFFKFKEHKTPESVKPYSGGLLYIHPKDKLELPDDMIYISDVIGWQVLKTDGSLLGHILEVNETPNQDLIVVKQAKEGKENFLIPWIDVFVKKIDEPKKIMTVDVSTLEGLYEN